MLSYWEKKYFLSDVDYCIIGSGIVGLTTAIFIKKKAPKAKVIILERGILPHGASTKNAGFACFGSFSEILDDISKHNLDYAINLVEKRWDGLNALKKLIPEKHFDLKNYGGYELFTSSKHDQNVYEHCLDNLSNINKNLSFIGKNVFDSSDKSIKKFDFSNTQHIIKNNYEAQINTGKLALSLLQKAHDLGILILNNVEVKTLSNNGEMTTNIGDFAFKKVIVCTNGFAKKLLPKLDVNPARAQVLITKPVKNLKLKGTFHYDKGYYYFRNIDNRVLFGGGRNLDFKGETTDELALTKQIQQQLERLLKEVILPNTPHEVDMRWAGIMGVGDSKETIIKSLSKNIFCAVRMGGMGVAIGTLVGKEAAKMVTK
ncbi:MAG: NAD(P)/FAD-dependent oxidoreductase [Bacteroidia bacterium]